MHIDSFIHGLRLRSSAPIFSHLSQDNADAELPRTKYGHSVHHGNQRRHHNIKNNTESKELMSSTIATIPENIDVVTPLERERLRIVRKVMESTSDTATSKCRAEFLKNAALNSGNVKAEALMEQLNRDGANLTTTEYDILTAPLHASPDGIINVKEFGKMVHEDGAHLHNYGDLGRLGIGLSVTNKNDPHKSSAYCPSNVSNVTLSAESSRARREEGYTGRKYLGSTQHALLSYANCFARDKHDRKELVKDRVVWSKVVDTVRKRKNCFEALLRKDEIDKSKGSFSAPLTTKELGRTLSSAGVRLNNSDLRMLQVSFSCNCYLLLYVFDSML